MSNFPKVKACLKAMGFTSLSSDSFQDKLIIQKVVFLLKMKGIDFTYGYGLHIRGPYSPSLTDDVYANSEELRNIDSEISLSREDAEIVEGLLNVVELKPSQLEIVATYAWFAYEKGQDCQTATASLREIKGFYSDTQIALGISRSKQLFYEPTTEQIDAAKREVALWETASTMTLRN